MKPPPRLQHGIIQRRIANVPYGEFPQQVLDFLKARSHKPTPLGLLHPRSNKLSDKGHFTQPEPPAKLGAKMARLWK
jgi:hypothetical protein